MVREIKGISPLATLAEGIPVRARVAIALIGADLALDRLRSSRDVEFARKAFDLARRWYDGEHCDLDQFEDMLANEDERYLSRCHMDAGTEEEKAAWAALGDAVAYTAFQAHRAAEEFPTPIVCEIGEATLDDLYGSLLALSPSFMDMLAKAAAYLVQEPHTSYARLKSHIPS
jgi:hypothetical protein